MPSPFPGMDPYLELHWRDVHSRFMIYASEQLQPRLPKDLRARCEERVLVGEPGERPHAYHPDVKIGERPPRRPPSRPGTQPEEGGGVAVAIEQDTETDLGEPIIVEVAEPIVEVVTETTLEIREAGTGGRVVTVIEVLSPANKRPGPDRDAFRFKIHELWHSGVNLVEIDLLRSGERTVGLPPDLLPESHRSLYQVAVRRATNPGYAEIYRVPLRESLPAVRIPLRESDRDVALALGPLIARCYEGGGYDDIDYTAELVPRFNEADAAWLDALLKEKGLRPNVAPPDS